MTVPDTLGSTRKDRGGEATRQKILQAGELEFAAKGFDGARLASIARTADVPQALIHHYFADKAGLYRAVFERVLGSMAARRAPSKPFAANSPSPALRIRSLVTSPPRSLRAGTTGAPAGPRLAGGALVTRSPPTSRTR